MFACAIVLGNAPEASVKFKHWLHTADSTGMLCPFLLQRTFSWGWIGIAGRGHLIMRQGAGGALLVVFGAVLDAPFRRELESSPDLEELTERLPKTTGQFVFASVREGSDRPVCVGTDNLGMRGMFWSTHKGVTAISNLSPLCGLMVDRHELDEEYMLDLITKDAVLPAKSMVADVHRIERGTHLVATGKQFRVVAGPHRDLHLWTRDRSAALESMRAAVRSLPDYGQQLLVGLTGGVDARLMQALLMAEKIPYETGTHSMPCLDGELARELARVAGVTHWSMGASRGDVLAPLTKYFTFLPWSEGTYSCSVINQPLVVHDLVAARGMIHLGGLGGETARSYWDMPSARFESPEELILARFFKPAFKGFYLTPEREAQSREAWLKLAQVEGTVDRFVSMQMAFHDARLRGTLALRCNSAHYDYAWPLSNPEFYAYAWRMPRSERQKGVIFDDFIREWAPPLLSVRWNKGNSGHYVKGGWEGFIQSAKNRVKRLHSVHILRGWQPLHTSGWTWSKIRAIFLLEFFADKDAHDWMHRHFARAGIELVCTLSPSYVSQAEKMMDFYIAENFLRSLVGGRRSATLWDLQWVQNAVAKASEIAV